jgi:hypothetical protein
MAIPTFARLEVIFFPVKRHFLLIFLERWQCPVSNRLLEGYLKVFPLRTSYCIIKDTINSAQSKRLFKNWYNIGVPSAGERWRLAIR